MAVSTYNSTTGVRTVVAGSENGSALDTRLTAVEEKIPSTASSTNKLVDENSLGTASTKDATDVVRTGNHDLVESNAVANAINQALSSIYVPRGSLSCAELTSALLIEANVGNVYEMSDSGTTSALFIQGAGTTISVGDNVGIIKAGQSTYMFNYMGNAFDLTDYQKKDLTTPLTIGGTSQTTVEGALGGFYGLLTQEPIGSYNFSTGGNSYQWLDLGTSPNTSNSQAFLLFEITYGRVDGLQTKAFVTCGGTMADANYINIYNLTNAQTSASAQFIVDSNKHLWFGMQSYCYAHIKVYGRWTGFGDKSLSTPTGTSLTVKRTLSTADLTSTVTSGNTQPVTSGGVWDKIKYDVEQVGWLQTNGGNSSTLTIPNGRFFFYFVEYESGGSITGCGIIFRFWSETSNPTISQINSASGLSLSLIGNTLTGTATTGTGYYRLRLFGIKS